MLHLYCSSVRCEFLVTLKANNRTTYEERSISTKPLMVPSSLYGWLWLWLWLLLLCFLSTECSYVSLISFCMIIDAVLTTFAFFSTMRLLSSLKSDKLRRFLNCISPYQDQLQFPNLLHRSADNPVIQKSLQQYTQLQGTYLLALRSNAAVGKITFGHDEF